MRPRGDSESPSAMKGSALGLTVTGGLQRKLNGGEEPQSCHAVPPRTREHGTP